MWEMDSSASPQNDAGGAVKSFEFLVFSWVEIAALAITKSVRGDPQKIWGLNIFELGRGRIVFSF